MKRLFTILLSLCFISAFAYKPTHQYISIKTDRGECIIMLYNSTPLHRDNFIKLTKKGTFNGTLFHRVIKSFMVQGGDPDSKNAADGTLLGEGSVGYTVPAEFRDSLFHKKGVLAAARDDNPEKASSGSQFYIVQGKVWTDRTLDSVQTKRMDFKIPEWQREVYKSIGGTPHLDRRYTVYGEVVQGLDLVDSIAAVKTDKNDRPLENISITVTVLKKREARKIEKELRKRNGGPVYLLNQ